ncbi:unnamed protein product [Didymodactylos carnosus]|uniref:Uncharacterized protein n=1 Tax=Didymodactylos carnosus TaxID=1234261 RepID=A0A8S2VR36_9BILA|nr:unnamed protein product [Didymodactylos carnosus]CAF4407081.1 unnamed protein product [Didymodactylos carnosus]
MGITPSLVHSINNDLVSKGVDAKGLVVTNTPACDAEIARVVKEKDWNGLFIGYGVRHDQQWFDRIINVVNQSNPKVKLLHHNGPSDVQNAIERHFHVKLPL